MNRLGMKMVKLVGVIYGVSMFVFAHAPTYANPPDLNPNCAFLPNSVTVTLNRWADEYGVAPGTPVSMSMEDYAWGVLVPELGSTVPSGTHAGSGWDKEVIKAQAIAARTIGAYKCNNLTATSPQRFRPYWSAVSSTIRTRFQNMSRKTKGMYLTWNGLELQDALGFQGQYQASVIDAEYRSDTGNPTFHGTAGPTGELAATMCPDTGTCKVSITSIMKAALVRALVNGPLTVGEEPMIAKRLMQICFTSITQVCGSNLTITPTTPRNFMLIIQVMGRVVPLCFGRALRAA